MPVNRCPHCGLVNPAKTMTCDCGYSFVSGAPPRFSHDKPRMGGSDVGSRLVTRVLIRISLITLLMLGVLAVRLCG